MTPDNGTLTHIHQDIGIIEIREIEESKHRRKNTEASYTFHGRDIYANTGAKLAANVIFFEEVGPLLSVERIVELPITRTIIMEDQVSGTIDILDVRFGSLWTSIERTSFLQLQPQFGEKFEVSIFNNASWYTRT